MKLDTIVDRHDHVDVTSRLSSFGSGAKGSKRRSPFFPLIIVGAYFFRCIHCFADDIDDPWHMPNEVDEILYA